MSTGAIGDIDPLVLEARFVRAYPPAAPPAGSAHYLPFIGGRLVTRSDFTLPSRPPLPLTDAIQATALFIGTLDGIPCIAYRLPTDTAVSAEFRVTGLRELYGQLGDDEYAVAGYAVQLLNWRDSYRFCSRCGKPAESVPGGWGMACPECGTTAYPPVTPAVLALIHDGADRVLLAAKPGWGKRFSIIAGFVEPGESLEGCAVRECQEEVGVHVRDAEYWGSQPWPFPHQLMVGFVTQHVWGDIEIDETELSEAAWFRYDALPELPPALSLSRRIIDAWVESRHASPRGGIIGQTSSLRKTTAA